MTRPRCSSGVLAVAVALVAVLTACGGGSGDAARARVRAAPAPTTTTVAPTTTTTAPAITAPPATTAAPAPAPATAAPSLADRLTGVGSAGQVIAVVADGYGTTTATVTAYERTGAGWQQTFGPWTAHIGYGGFAPPGEKHEGDGRTPSGAYGFDFFFGVQPDPGVHFAYRAITPSIVWDDDPASARYNEWVDRNVDDPGANPEPMENVPAYRYGAVIAYNDARTPGLGSAIFLHVSTGGSTAGCVSLPEDELLAVLRWLDPARGPRIVMGTTGVVTS